MKLYSVVVEDQGAEPVMVVQTTNHAQAVEWCYQLCERRPGRKVNLVTDESDQQLQVHKGRAFRDQPDLAASGEALTIHVPTAKARFG